MNKSNTPNRGGNRPSAKLPDSQKPKKKNKAAKSQFIKTSDIVRVRSGIDRPMLIIIIILLCFGTVMVFSASFAYSLEKYGDSYYYIKRQLLIGSGGFILMIVISFVDYKVVKMFTTPVFTIAILLLAIVPFIGISQGEATRWIIVGPVSFQPSELMKITLVLFLANYVANNQERITNYRDLRESSVWGVFMPVGVIGIVCILIALENHISGTIIMFCIGILVVFVGGGRPFWFGVAGIMAGLAIMGVIFFTDYAKTRLDMWMNPENYSSINEIWQTTQGLIAVGSGGFLGVGLGNSRQKHMFVSQPQNDFIFSIICEELGFVGALAVIALFVLFIWRGYVIAMRAPDTFSSLAVIGIVGHIAIQAILNIAVVTNMMPNTGVSLPFFSYGGTALLILLSEMGILLSISRFSYR